MYICSWYFPPVILLIYVEFWLQALESFLLRCPRDISSYCDEILCLSLEYLSYDPNFTDNMEEDTDDESHEEEEDEYVLLWFMWVNTWHFVETCLIMCGHYIYCSESANEYTDDEDVSWKVRRAAAKCLAALIVSRPELLSKLYEEVSLKFKFFQKWRKSFIILILISYIVLSLVSHIIHNTFDSFLCRLVQNWLIDLKRGKKMWRCSFNGLLLDI